MGSTAVERTPAGVTIHSFLPFADTAAKREATNEALDALFADAGRKIAPRGALKKPSFKKHGDPGAESNRNTVGYGFAAYALRGDMQAILQVALVAERLFETWDTLDRAHSHRYAWLGPLALALHEMGDERWKIVLDRFNDIIRWFHGQKYLNGSFVGATLRPLRCLFEAGLTGSFAEKLSRAGLPADSFGGAQLVEKANTAVFAFLWRVLGSGVNWGWRKPPGAWAGSWRDFPYVDSTDPKTMATHTTLFHALHVMPYSFMVGDLAGLPLIDDGSLYATRWREIASHALRLGYDPVSGRSTKSIGYKADHSAGKREAYYAPGFPEKPARKQSLAWKDEHMEAGYHDVSPALEAVLDSGEINKNECRRGLVKFVRGARGIVVGEIPIGLARLALRVG